VYGHKDGKAMAWVKAALSGAEMSETIDVSTEQGRAAALALLASKQVDWGETVSELKRQRLN
jgi:hypothetical protein